MKIIGYVGGITLVVMAFLGAIIERPKSNLTPAQKLEIVDKCKDNWNAIGCY